MRLLVSSKTRAEAALGPNLGSGISGAKTEGDILSPVTLPCGLTVPNRFAKVALYEHLAAIFGGPPNVRHYALYSKWAQGNWGIVMTGNVQIDRNHLSLGRDITIPRVLTRDTVRPFEELAQSIHGADTENRPLAILQLSHGGRQSPNIIGGRWPFVSPLAPSASRLNLDSESPAWTVSGLISRFFYQTPRAMSLKDIEDVVEAFVRSAKLAVGAGFDGIELHAAHGYLLAEFISPQSNLRTDQYSASANPLRLLLQIATAVREVVPSEFALGIKLNAADYAHGAASDETLVLQHVREIANWRMIDFIEVSGGTYERPEFITGSLGSKRQAIFSRFSRLALHELEQLQETTPGLQRPLILLTGGLSSVDLMESALRHKHADLLGIGRLSILSPRLPRALMESPREQRYLEPSPPVSDIKPWDMEPLYSPTSWYTVEMIALAPIIYLWSLTPKFLKPRFPRYIGAGLEVSWYTVAMRNLAAAEAPDYRRIYAGSGLGAFVRMWFYAAPGGGPWFWLFVAMLSATAAVGVAFKFLTPSLISRGCAYNSFNFDSQMLLCLQALF
ncbi:uncharacterized protein PHACADRAFT_138900 [Phanerochaete carnosa HHB-10118-sp]|uniref:NADH:flavin oxidoreductase/NADH oxidase N-terminal domain-containing protein n=1 Tax=Phanerochaete carnosa (strain HHB-10118-sp) TaxID=650164 RepID=K5X4A0_PHACS|nr:uncharacterized protein PHACADRAFT_138900 [Phanerochaete carnosa HHB-10118-sp]EKM57662.1 hypothetical protein PHACADRAFT_138900 [Phanerochaete carnosa HHB-10118-sp]